MLMSSLQFASQIVMARFVLAVGLVRRKNPDKLSWRQYCVQGEVFLQRRGLSVASVATSRVWRFQVVVLGAGTSHTRLNSCRAPAHC